MPTTKGKKPKGAVNTSNDVKRLITDTYKNHRDWSATKVRETVAQVCKDKRWRCPSRSTVGNIIREVEKKLAADPRLELWSLASVTKYPSYFPPDVIPLLLKMQYGDLNNQIILAEQNEDWEKLEKLEPMNAQDTRLMTVWQAMWVARLYKIPGIEEVLEYLSRWYAIYEESSELAGIPVDTHFIDSSDVKIMLQKIQSFQGGTEFKVDESTWSYSLFR